MAVKNVSDIGINLKLEINKDENKCYNEQLTMDHVKQINAIFAS